MLLKDIELPEMKLEGARRSLYLAGPFFKPEEIDRIKFVEKLCEKYIVLCNSPRKFLVLPPRASWEKRQLVFIDNIRKISESEIMLANVDQPLDSGTLWEMGAAFGMGKPVVCFTLGDNPKMNVMLAQGCEGFLGRAEDLENFLEGAATGYAEVDSSGRYWDFKWEEAHKWRREIF